MRIKPMRRGGWALVLAALALAGCDRGAQEAAPVPAQVSVLTLTARQVTLEDELPGRVAPVRMAEIRPQVGGIIQRRLFEQGAEIRAGQPLFQINPAPFKADADMAAAALQRAEAALVRARVQAARLQPLVEADAVSRQVYDDAVSQRDQAAADVAVATRPGIAGNQTTLGFGFSGSGPNAAMAFTMLKDWGERDGATAADEVARAQQAMAGIAEGDVMVLLPPAIEELSTSSGFSLQLQDRANQGLAALAAAEAQLLDLAANSRLVANVYRDGLPVGPSVVFDS